MLTRLRRFFPPGIRLQLAFWYTIAFAVLLLVTGEVFYRYLESSLEASVDTDLQIRAQQIAGEIASRNSTLTIYDVTGDLSGSGTQTNPPPVQPVDVNYWSTCPPA